MWSIQGDFVYRQHIEPRVQLYVPKEETIPLEYIDVMTSTDLDLDVAQEKRMDDFWNVRPLPKDICGPEEEVLDQIIFGQKHGHGSGKPLRR